MQQGLQSAALLRRHLAAPLNRAEPVDDIERERERPVIGQRKVLIRQMPRRFLEGPEPFGPQVRRYIVP